MIWRCARFFTVLLKFKMAATDQFQLFGGRKNSTCGCASDFLEMLSKFKMVARSQPQIFLWTQKLENLSSEIIQISQSNSPQYGDVQVIF